MTSAAWLNASLWIRIAPSTDFSASRLCGSVRSGAAAAISGIGRETKDTAVYNAGNGGTCPIRGAARRDQRLSIAAAVALLLTTAVLRLGGVERALRLACRPIAGPPLSEAEVEARARAIARAGRYLPGGACLPQAVALTCWLRRRGVDAEIRIGVRRAGGFAAHAWVERAGEPLINDESSGFAALPRAVGS